MKMLPEQLTFEVITPKSPEARVDELNRCIAEPKRFSIHPPTLQEWVKEGKATGALAVVSKRYPERPVYGYISYKEVPQGRYWKMHEWYVRERWQKSGLGTELLRELSRLAGRKGHFLKIRGIATAAAKNLLEKTKNSRKDRFTINVLAESPSGEDRIDIIPWRKPGPKRRRK